LTIRTIRKPPCFGWLPVRSIETRTGGGVGEGVGLGVGLGVGDGDGEGDGGGEWVGNGEGLGEDVAAVPPPHATTASVRTSVTAARSDRIAINGNGGGARRVFE
jgi:hypothetical protein